MQNYVKGRLTFLHSILHVHSLKYVMKEALGKFVWTDTVYLTYWVF